MAWDLGLDPATGDFIFGANRDLMGVSGEDLDRQRISVRVKIPLGTFAYDETELLGSRLHSALRLPMERGLAEIPKLIEEALAPMSDIQIRDVLVEMDEEGKIVLGPVIRTNHARNPSFEIDVNGYGAYQNGINGTLTRSLEVPGFSGAASAKLLATSSGSGDLGIVTDFTTAVPVASGETWTVTAHSRATTIPRSFFMIVVYYSITDTLLGVVSGVAKPDVVGEWTRANDLTVTIPTAAELGGVTPTQITVYCAVTNPANGEAHHVDGFLIEKSSSAGTYFDGDNVSDSEWSNLRHNSISHQHSSIFVPPDPRKVKAIVKYAHTPDRGDTRLTADETDELEVSISL